MFTMTKAQALAKQAEQVEHYRQFCPDIADRVRAHTTAECLADGVEYPVAHINRHIPRGGAIERLIAEAHNGRN